MYKDSFSISISISISISTSISFSYSFSPSWAVLDGYWTFIGQYLGSIGRLLDLYWTVSGQYLGSIWEVSGQRPVSPLPISLTAPTHFTAPRPSSVILSDPELDEGESKDPLLADRERILRLRYATLRMTKETRNISVSLFLVKFPWVRPSWSG